MAKLRCAIYTRKSSEEGLEQSFNSLDAQREACLSYIESQRHEGWKVVDEAYDDGGFSGGNMERPGLMKLLVDIKAGKVDSVVVYNVDRLTRSLADFAKMVETFDESGVSFVSVTQQFNTTTSMGRLTLNVLLSFAQFEREVTGERIRDKIAASKRKGMWMGGRVPVGYDVKGRALVVNNKEASQVRHIYERYIALGSVAKLKQELDAQGIRSKDRLSKTGKRSGNASYSRGALYDLLQNRIYRGVITHRDQPHAGMHEAIVPEALWEKVQALLKTNDTAKRTGTKAQASSLLTGLLFDAEGQRLTPTHTVKNGKRYRYYVSQALIRNPGNNKAGAKRYPAHDIEVLVIQRLQTFLSSGPDVLESLALPSDDASLQSAVLASIGSQAAKLTEAAQAETRTFLQAVVSRIILACDEMQIQLSRQHLQCALLGNNSSTQEEVNKFRTDDNDERVSLRIKNQLRRCGGEMQVIVPESQDKQDKAHPNPAMIKAIVRAHSWHERLISGEAKSIRSIAKEIGVHERYVSHILHCAFLAPDVVDTIMEGRQPLDLTLEKLLNGLPRKWDEQRRTFQITDKNQL